jgi:hypothetical protein
MVHIIVHSICPYGGSENGWDELNDQDRVYDAGIFGFDFLVSMI